MLLPPRKGGKVEMPRSFITPAPAPGVRVVCPFCKARFAWVASLALHVTRHHGGREVTLGR
jgi:hypothetical protein